MLMNSSLKNNNDDILKAILYVKSKKIEKSRKVTLNDLMIKSNNKSNTKTSNDQIKSFRMQEEFGPKKRIKP